MTPSSDIKGLVEGDLEWLRKMLNSDRCVRHCGEGLLEIKTREMWNARIDRILQALASISSREENGFKHPDGFRSELPAPATQAEREAVEQLIVRHLQYIANPSAVAKPLADAILSLLEPRRTPPDPHPLTALLTRWDNGESVGDLITQYLRGEGDWGPVRVLVESLGLVACSAEPSLASRVSDNGPATPSGGE